MFKKLIIVFFVVFISFTTKVLAISNNSQEYIITNYEVDLVVNENNVFNISEKIEANFKIRKHGIFRKIPLSYKVTRLDGTISKGMSKISDIQVNDTFTTYNENGNKVIKIGSEYKTLTGKNEYKINYIYNIGKDYNNKFDELYFNIIGTEWDTTIENVTFKITMPKAFDESKLGFSVGNYGSTQNEGLNYSVNGNIISGFYTGILNPSEGINVRLELPEGYFVNASSHLNGWILLAILLPIIFVIISFGLWYVYGKEELVIETVEFYPPEEYNSAEVGFLYKGYANSNDVTSLLIYLANKGYIKISEIKENISFISKNSFEITKVKKYDGDNKNEKLFLDGLFIYGDSVTQSGLYNRFYTYLNMIKADLNGKKNRDKIFVSGGKSIFIICMILLTILMTIGLIAEAGDIGLLILTIYPLYLFQFIVSIICIIAMIIFIIIMPKRNHYGNEILGKIKGFKTFLETAEKDKLESLVMQDPEYFYNILPYTYVLGVSDKWIKKFESIALKEPDWYVGKNTFNAITFAHFMKSTMSTASAAMSSMPSTSSSSGRSSGGGFSGGGHGGGGGGSW